MRGLRPKSVTCSPLRKPSCNSCNGTDIKKRLTAVMIKNKDDIKKPSFWRAAAAEFLASLFLVLVGCGAWIAPDKETTTIRVALAFGFMYAVLIYCLRHISGALINPVVSVAMTATCKISIARGAVFVVVQTLGAIIGAAILHGVTADAYRDTLGCTTPNNNVTEGQAFGIEFFTTFILLFITFACFEEHTVDEERRCPGHLIIGLTVAALSCFAIPLSGGSFNPARSFGPAVVRGIWTDHWIYWFGCIFGGLLGGVTYDAFFAKKATVGKLIECLTRIGIHGPGHQKTAPPTDNATAAEQISLREAGNKLSTESLQDVGGDDSSEDNLGKTTVQIA